MSWEEPRPSRIRVRYPEVDRMGFVHHARYFEWLEIGRTDLIRATGASYRELEESEGVLFPVVEAHLNYRRSARYDDEVDVKTALVECGRSRLRFEYHLERVEGRISLADGFTVHACIDRRGQLTRIPSRFRDSLARLDGVHD